jgi:hypothetical protein
MIVSGPRGIVEIGSLGCLIMLVLWGISTLIALINDFFMNKK